MGREAVDIPPRLSHPFRSKNFLTSLDHAQVIIIASHDGKTPVFFFGKGQFLYQRRRFYHSNGLQILLLLRFCALARIASTPLFRGRAMAVVFLQKD